MDVNINSKRLNILRQRNISRLQAYIEIEKLLRSSLNGNGDEVAQFQADRFIADQFCMLWPERKPPKQAMKRPVVPILPQEHVERFFPLKMDAHHNRQKRCGMTQDAYNPSMNISQYSPSNDSKIQPVNVIETRTKKLNFLLEEGFDAYRLGQYGLAATKYKIAWEMVADADLKSRVERINEDVICYILCLSLLETDQLNNLSEAVELLVALEKRSSHIFPAVYYALSKAHYKHYRFSLALEAIHKGLVFLEGDVQLTEYKIPGSHLTLKESTKDGLLVSLAAMKDECSKWHPPDAVCCMGECLPSSRWYSPNRDIYFSDPTFNGMVVLTCNNARNPCTMKFHQACWKSKKDQLSALKKFSDKDIIGYECFTPNCEYGQGTRSLITKVEVYGDDGRLKARIEAPANPVVWTKRRSSTKGAIPKQQIKPKQYSEKMRRPLATAAPRSSCKEAVGENRTDLEWRLAKLAKLRQNNFGIKPAYEWRPDKEMYGSPQMMEIGDFLGGPIFETDCPELVEIKTFIFTYFYEFIKENGCVKREAIAQKWEQDKFLFDKHSDALPSETDICEFLLQSYRLASIRDYIGIAEDLPEMYAMVRSEIRACFRFLLGDSIRLLSAAVQDDISSVKTGHSGEMKNDIPTLAMHSDIQIDTTDRLDKIQRVNETPPVAITSDSPQPNVGFNTYQWSQNGTPPWNLMTQNISSWAVQKPANDSVDPENLIDSTFISDDSLDPDEPKKLEEIHGPNCYLELSDNNSINNKLGTNPNSCQIGPQLVPNTQEEGVVVEPNADAEEGCRIYDLPQESVLTNGRLLSINGLQRKVSNKDSHNCESDLRNRRLDSTIDFVTEINRNTQKVESHFEASAIELECSDTNRDGSDGTQPVIIGCRKSPLDNGSMTGAKFPEGSFQGKEDHRIALTGTKMVKTTKETATLSASRYQDTLAESNVRKIENDLAVMVQTVARLKSVLEQNQAKSGDQVRTSQEGMAELMKDSNRLEARCVKLESEKLEIMHQFQDCELELRQSNDNNVVLTLKNTELMYKYDKLSEEKKNIEHNFTLLLKEKSEIESKLEMLQKERDQMNKKLQKYHARLKDKSSIDSEPVSCLQEGGDTWSQKCILDAARLNEKKLKLQSLNHEFSINKYMLEKAFEKCYDHISMLNDVSKLITLVTGQHFVVTEAQAAWQSTEYHLRRIIEQYKADYLRLEALLKSDEPIANLNDVHLPTLNIVFPQPPNLAELYYKERAKFIQHHTPVVPNLWATQGAHHWNPHYFPTAASAFYPNQNLEPKVNEKIDPNNDADELSQRSCNDNDNGAGFKKKENTAQQGPTSTTDIRPSTETQDFDSRIRNDVSLYDAENNDKGVSQASCPLAAVGRVVLKDTSQISVNKRSVPSKNIGRDLLMQELKKKYVGVPEHDLLESLRIVRKLHNHKLSGMRVQDIIQESEPFIKQRQTKHMAHYSRSKQTLPPERLYLQPNKPSHRKLPSSMPLGTTSARINKPTNTQSNCYVSGQQKKIRGVIPEQGKNLAIHTSKASAAAPAMTKKPAWGPVLSGSVKWKKNQEDSECSICIEIMKVGDKRAPIYVLPCQHSFHTSCIKKWLGETSICPICREHCTMDDEFPPLPS